MNKKHKIIIIGFGSIGRRHYKNLCQLGFKDVYVYDIDKKRIVGKDIKTVPDIKHKNLAQFDVAFICSPSSAHIKTALQCAKAGCHLFIEKPLSCSVAHINELQKLCKKNKLVAMVACNYLFHKGLIALLRILKSDLYGKPLLSRFVMGYSIPVHRKYIYAAQKKYRNETLVLDSGSHIMNCLVALFGDIKNGFIYRSKISSLGIKSEESAAMVFEHKRGVLSTVALDYVSRKRAQSIDAVTDKGTLTIDFMDDLVKFENESKSKGLYRGDGDSNKMFVDEIKHFFECVEQRQKPLQDLNDGKRIIEILLKASAPRRV